MAERPTGALAPRDIPPPLAARILVALATYAAGSLQDVALQLRAETRRTPGSSLNAETLELAEALESLASWGRGNDARSPVAPRHAVED